MTEKILGRPLDEALLRKAEETHTRIVETAAPVRGGQPAGRDGVLHVVAVREGEWVAARFPVGLPRKEQA